MVVANNDVDKLVNCFLVDKESGGYHKQVKMQKAGIWQGTDSFKDLNMLVMRDVNFYLDCNQLFDKLIKNIKPNMEWCHVHFNERIGGNPLNPGESYKLWPYANLKEGDEFLKENLFDHTYMERFWPKFAGNVLGLKSDNENWNEGTKEYFFTDKPKPLDGTHPSNIGIRFKYGDLNDVIKQLADNPLTRQAYLPIFFPEDTGSVGNLRVPCTLGYLFEIEENKINITYYIRSCDVYRHLRNDIYLAYLLLGYVNSELHKLRDNQLYELGMLNMKIANLHLFENDTYPLVKRENKWKQENE